TRDGRPFLAAEIEDLSGSVEVTVWPDVFDRTRDLWAEGNILLVTVQVRSRNDRLQVSVQRAAAYESEKEQGTGKPLKAAAVGGRNPAPRRENPEPRTENHVPRSSSPDPHSLHITLTETEDTESDQERLRAVMSALQEFEGDDEVRLTIRQRDGDEVELELPRTRACGELSERLGGVLGDGSVAEFV
ncbi:MAG: OB-fold nucleic acid binding domain-containing protein, partial [Chloroflexota bacterium]|nr:OB-fold nucleic acid binding domain-containing protein [Chloroflexota bacterium]